MAFCSGCGTEFPDGAKFCANCGRALGATTAALPAPPAEPAPELIQQRMKTNLPDFVRNALHPREMVFGAFSASLFDHHKRGEAPFVHDKFILTDTRIVYYHTGLIHKGMGEMPYRSITETSYNKGLIHGKVVVEAANAGLTMDGIANDDAAFIERIIAGLVAGRKFTTLAPTTLVGSVPPSAPE